MKIIKKTTLLAVLLLSLCACGSGGVTGTPSQQKTVILTFSTYTTINTGSAQLQGIQLGVHLPAGVTAPCTPTGKNNTGQLQYFPDTALSNTNGVITFKFAVLQSVVPNPITLGTFATLTCAVTPGVTLHSTDFPDAATFPLQTAEQFLEGYATSAGGTLINLLETSQLRVGVSEVAFGY